MARRKAASTTDDELTLLNGARVLRVHDQDDDDRAGPGFDDDIEVEFIARDGPSPDEATKAQKEALRELKKEEKRRLKEAKAAAKRRGKGKGDDSVDEHDDDHWEPTPSVGAGAPRDASPMPRRSYHAAHSAPMRDIHFEVDNLESIRAGHLPRNTPYYRTDLRREPEQTLYETEHGRVTKVKPPEGDGAPSSRIYVQGATAQTRQPFHPGLVDPIIDNVDLAGERVVQEEVTEYVPRKRRVVRRIIEEEDGTVREEIIESTSDDEELVAFTQTDSPASDAAKPKRGFFGRKDKQSKNKKAKKGSKQQPHDEPESPIVERASLPTAPPAPPAPLSQDEGWEPEEEPATEAEPAPVLKESIAAPEAAPPARTAPRPAPKPAAKPAAKSVPKKTVASNVTADKEYQPQCGGITAAGDQCRNSARTGSKYCASHKGFRPVSKEVARAAKDTKPAVAKAADTAPAARKVPAKPDDKEYQPQCAGITAAGDQCRNSARAGSKYCASHKGFRPVSKEVARAAKDTKPAVLKAADTAPAARKPAAKPAKKAASTPDVCPAVTAAGKPCKNPPRAGSKYCGPHKGYRAR